MPHTERESEGLGTNLTRKKIGKRERRRDRIKRVARLSSRIGNRAATISGRFGRKLRKASNGVNFSKLKRRRSN